MRWSIVILIYNKVDFLPQALESIVAQTTAFYLIIVGNGSTNASIGKARAQLADYDGIVASLYEPRPGQVQTFQTRIAAVSSEFTAICDALVSGSSAETFGLVASEALSSGLPLMLPNAGAVIAYPDFIETYTLGNANDAVLADVRLLDRHRHQLRFAANLAAATARTLDDHFADPFWTYADAISEKREAA